MKTDQEFLRGIYEKAVLAREEDSVKVTRRPYHKYVRYAAMVAVLALLIVPASIYGTKKQTPQTQGEPGNEPLTISSQRTIPTSSNIFDGTITTLEVKNGEYYITISIDETYVGKLSGEVTLYYKPSKESVIFSLKEGEKALFYTDYNKDMLVVNEAENGICRYLYNENGTKVYETYFGEKVYANELKSQ